MDFGRVESNFPMALDEADHRLFVGVYVRPRMAVCDTQTGRLMAALPSVQAGDDLRTSRARQPS